MRVGSQDGHGYEIRSGYVIRDGKNIGVATLTEEALWTEVEWLRKQLERTRWCLWLLAECTPPGVMRRYRERLRAEAPWRQKDEAPPT